MKTLLVVCLGLCFFLLAGCQAGETPENAVRAFVEAMNANNVELLLEKTCTNDRPTVSLALGLAGGTSLLPSEMDTSSLRYSVISQNGNTAQVQVIDPAHPDSQTTMNLRLEDGKWHVCFS